MSSRLGQLDDAMPCLFKTSWSLKAAKRLKTEKTQKDIAKEQAQVVAAVVVALVRASEVGATSKHSRSAWTREESVRSISGLRKKPL